jgi:Flp pilus assembly protein TadD/ADP-heptose:LPS heptosyltransferase
MDALYVEQQYQDAERLYLHGSSLDALNIIEPVLKAGFESAAMWNLAGACGLSLNRLVDAERAFRRAIELYPDYRDAHSNLGAALTRQERYTDAVAALHHALSIDSTHAATYSNLGVALQGQKLFGIAEHAYRQALHFQPDFTDAAVNLGKVLRDQGRTADAEAVFREVVTLHPDLLSAKAELTHIVLADGRYEEGWRLYEHRYDARLANRAAVPPNIAVPKWNGESLNGKSILVYAEQGNGDTIQFSRFFPVLKQMGAAKVTFVCADRLHRLMQNARGLDKIMSEPEKPDARNYDFWTFLLSIPLHANTTLKTIPSTDDVLSVPQEDIERWRLRLNLLPGLKVGLVWKGSAFNLEDKTRSLPGLKTLAPLWDCAAASFVSLQKGQGEDEAMQPPPGQPLLHLGSDIENFADTAAIISQLDVLITVDTAAAHVAGALGKRCWVLLPATRTDWRWMHSTSSTPWYPHTRLFRQTQPNDWSAPVEAMCNAFACLLRA